jgi:hypothetical protein
MNRNKLPFEPHHLWVSSGVSKMISEPMVRLAQTVHLCCTKTNTVFKRIEMSFHLSLVTLEYHPVHPKEFLSLWYVGATMHLSSTETNTISKRTEWRFSWPTSLGVLSGASKMISEAMVCLVQTVDLPCTETNTISKWTKTRFYMMHVTKGFHRVRRKWFPSLWYVQHKPYIYLESRLELSANGDEVSRLQRQNRRTNQRLS